MVNGQCPSIISQGFVQGPDKEPKTIDFGHLGDEVVSSDRYRPKAEARSTDTV